MDQLISIIIRTFNEERFIGDLLHSIRAQSISLPLEIVLVDSESSDRTIEIVQSFPDVKLVIIKKSQFSFGRALNLGCATASGQILVSISGHCIPADENWLRNLVEPLLGSSKAAFVYGRQIGIAEKWENHPSTRFSERRIFSRHYPESGLAPEQPYMNNANSSFLRAAWEINRFDESLPGLEDLKFAIDLLASGRVGVYAPTARVIHLHDENNARVFNRFFREEIARREIFSDQPERHSFSIFIEFLFNLSSDLLACIFAPGGIKRHYITISGYRMAQYYAIYLAWKLKKIKLDELSGAHESFLKWITKGRYSFENIRTTHSPMLNSTKNIL
jgi:rhamnosyltransferase